MSALLDAARVGDLAKIERLIQEGANVHEVNGDGKNALMIAVIHLRIPVVKWLVKTGGVRILDRDVHRNTALAHAAKFSGPKRYSLIEWLLEQGGALITVVTMLRGESKSLWDILKVPSRNPKFVSLLRVMVLLGDAPSDFIVKLSDYSGDPRPAQIAAWGPQIRALRPSYLEQQQASVDAHFPLPAVLLSIIIAYVEPTAKDMLIGWVHWM
jgi:hypothetical protein